VNSWQRAAVFLEGGSVEVLKRVGGTSANFYVGMIQQQQKAGRSGASLTE
jgi:hypothetical protein